VRHPPHLLPHPVSLSFFISNSITCLPIDTGNPLDWNVADVGKWLIANEMDIFYDAFEKNLIDGRRLREMNEETLRKISVSLQGRRTSLLKLITTLFQ
jgi:hypothetical protein